MPTPVLVYLLCLSTAAAGAFGNVFVRLMSVDLDTVQIAFFRNLFGLVSAAVLLPLVRMPGQSILAGAFAVPRLLWVAAILNIVSMFCFFTGVALLPLGDMTALSFAAPVWSTIGAALILGETVRRSRWIATVGGLIGVIVVLRPGTGSLSPMAFVVVFGTIAYALSSLAVKVASRRQTALVIVLQMALLMTLLSFVPALFVWRWPSMENWLLGAGVGTLATLGWFALTKALALADASAIAPYDFARLPLTILPAFLMFGEIPDAFAIAGSAIIFVAALYASRQEMRADR